MVSTPASVFVLDAEDGAVLYQTRTRLGSYGGVRRIPGSNRVWVTDLMYDNNTSKQEFRLYELDVVTDTVLRFLEFTVPNLQVLTEFPLLRIALTSDATHIAFVFNFRFDDASAWPYVALGMRSVLYWINTSTMLQKSFIMPYSTAIKISPDNKLMSIAGIYSYWKGLGSRTVESVYFDGTMVIDILGDSLGKPKTFEYQFKPSPLFDFFFLYRTIISIKDLKPITNAATSLIDDEVVGYAPDALAYFSYSKPPYDSLFYVYRDILSNDTLAMLRSPRFNEPVSFYFPFDSVMVASNRWGALAFFNLKGLLGGQQGIIIPVADTISERTIFRLPGPRTSPVNARYTYQYSSNGSFLKDDVFFSDQIDSCWLAVEANLDNGLTLRAKKNIELAPLKHDEAALQYWSMGSGYGLVSSISENGKYISSALHDVSLITNINDWKIDIGLYPESSITSTVAVDNLGIVHSTNYIIDSAQPEQYHYTIRSRKQNEISDSLQSITFNNYIYPGVQSLLTVTRWREGFGSRVATLTVSPNSFEDTLAFDLELGTALSFSDEFCAFYPKAFDIDMTTGKKYLGGYVMNSLPNSKRYGTMSDDGSCELIGSGQDFRYFILSADGKYLISDQGVRDINFQMITPTTAFADFFLPVAGTSMGITFNADTLSLWQIPEAILVNKIGLPSAITGVSSTGSSDRILIQFNNGTVELMRALNLFPELPNSTNNKQTDEVCSAMSVFPNPVSESCQLTSPLFSLPNVHLLIYSSLGELILHITSGFTNAGFRWNTTASDGLPVRSGMYYFIITAQNDRCVGKIVVLK